MWLEGKEEPVSERDGGKPDRHGINRERCLFWKPVKYKI